MKKILSLLLVMAMLLSLSATALAEPLVRDGSNFYAESSEVAQNELYAALLAFYGANYESLASSAVKKAVKAPSWYSTVIDSVAVDEESIDVLLDGDPVAKDSTDPVNVTTGRHTANISFDYSAEYHFEKIIGSDTQDGGTYDGSCKGSDKRFNFSVRLGTVISVAKDSVSYTYGTENAADLIMSTVQPVVALNNGTPIEGSVSIAENVSKLDAGTHEITLKYAGLADNGEGVGYMPATKTVTVNVSKAKSGITVEDTVIPYDGQEHMPAVVVTPEGVPYTLITVGLQGDAEGFASIYMSEGNALYDTLIFLRNSADTLSFFAKLIGIDISDFVVGSEGLSLSELINVITNLNKLASLLPNALDNAQIEILVQALEGVKGLMDTFGVDAKFYIGNMPKNSGLYGTFAVINEANYETALDSAMITITPDFNVSMKWNQPLAGSFTVDNVKDFDFTAFVTADGETPLDAQINYSITGFGSDGKYFSGDLENLPTLPGTYTETATCLLNYASMNLRIFTIDKYPTTVIFVDENGMPTSVPDIDTDYDGDPKGADIQAVVLDRFGNVIEDAELTYSYTGTTKAGVKYSSSEAPTDSGDYTLKVSFAGDLYNAASSAATVKIAIHKPAITVSFANTTTRILQKVDYSKIEFTVEGVDNPEKAQAIGEAIRDTLGCKWKLHIFIGTHNYTYSVPTWITDLYDVTVTGSHTVKLFLWF